MNNRLEYVDAIKGFAVLLMVMGHVLAWMFPDCRVLVNPGESPALLWNFIYSFHMPLFAFMSGYLFGFKRLGGMSGYFRYVSGKSITLLVPFVVSGLLLHFYYDVVFNFSYKYLTYWYLVALFMWIAVVGFVFASTENITHKKLGFFVDVFCTVFLGVASIVLNHYVVGPLHRNIHGLRYLYFGHFCAHYFYFLVGAMTTRYKRSLTRLPRATIWFVICFIAWLAFFAGSQNCSFAKYLMPWAGVFATFIFFRCRIVPGVFLSKRLIEFGRISLSIYIFHLFFRVPFYAAGCWFVDIAERYQHVGRLLTIPVQFIVSLIMSIAIIMCCAAVDRGIKKVPYIRTLLIGVRR